MAQAELRRVLNWLGERADEVWRTAQAAIGRDQLRIGVTGLSGAGKTVFTTSLIHALKHAAANPGAMPLFATRLGTEPIVASIEKLDELPLFPYAENIAGLIATPPRWPRPTDSLCGVRVRLGKGGDQPAQVTIDIVDYPGEWLLDLELLRLDFAQWSSAAVERVTNNAGGEARAWIADVAAASTQGEAASRVVESYASLLRGLRARGFRHLQPGRLLAGAADAAASAPAPLPTALAGSALFAAMEARYDAYRQVQVEGFFRDHFAKLDRQIVLFDVIGALAKGPAVMADTQAALASVLTSFRYRQIPWLDWLRARIDRVLVAATKVDHVTTSQYLNLRQLLAERFEGSEWTEAIADERIRFDVVASIRSTVDGWIRHDGAQRAAIRGVLKSDPGVLRLLVPSDVPPKPPMEWPPEGFVYADFAPPDLSGFATKPFPNVNLDKALDFLIGDRLQ